MTSRVCILTTSYPRFAGDDAGIFVQHLVRALGEQGVQGVVVVPKDGDEPSECEEGAFSVVRYRYGLLTRGRLAFGAGILPNLRRRPLLALQAPMLLGGFVRTAVALRGSFKVIHAQWVLAVIPGVLLATLLRIPYLVTLRGEDIRLLRRRLFGSLLVPLLRRAAAVVTVSESFASELRERHRLTGERVHFIPNGVEVSPPREDVVQALRDSFLPVEGMALLLFVGTVIPRKDVVTVVRALAEPGMERSVLVVCGRLDDERYVLEVEELAARLGVDNRLHLRGAVGTGQVPHYLAAARYYVTASTFEGRSNSLLEALSAGVPVIASDIPAHREVVSHGENGLLFTPKDPVALAHHIRILESSPERRALLSNGAKQSALQFTWERCAAEHVRLYASVGNRGA